MYYVYSFFYFFFFLNWTVCIVSECPSSHKFEGENIQEFDESFVCFQGKQIFYNIF